MPILPVAGIWPTIAADAFIAPTALLAGAVTVESGANIWFGAVLRGDVAPIRIGARSNVQDNCVLHADEGYPCVVGAESTLGHGAIVHGAQVGAGVLIGMHSTVLNGAHVEAGSIVAAGALVPEGMHIAAGMLVVGIPARVLRTVTEGERTRQQTGVRHYLEAARQYAEALRQMREHP